MDLAEKIKSFFKGEVHTEAEVLESHSRDASLLKVMPKVVVFPRDAEDISNLVKFVASEKAGDASLSITARAAGTCMSGGSLNESIILDVSKFMGGVKEVGADYATALPGTFYRDFEKETLAKGLVMPSFPASKNLCALGGMVANNAGGERSLSYGKTEDYVRSLKMIFADGVERVVKPLIKSELDEKMEQQDFEGKVYRELFQLVTENVEKLKEAKPKVSKNSAGYYLWNIWNTSTALGAGGPMFDLPKLIVGSQGTLGMITEITFKLVPVKPISKLLVIFLSDLAPVSKLVNELLPFKPDSIESYDDNTIYLAMRFWRGILKSMKVKHFFKLIWSFVPESLMILRGGIPKLVVLAEFAGDNEAEIDEKLKQAADKVRLLGLHRRATKTPEEAEKYWTIRHESFNLLRQHVKGKRTAPFIDDIVVNPEYLPEFLPALTKILDRHKLNYTVAGHAGNGNFHIIPLMGPKELANKKVITEVSDLVYDLVAKYKGSIDAEHNDGIIRTPYLNKMFKPDILELFKRTKEIFDPQNIFNPGKKVGGSLKYMRDHLSAEVS